MSTLSTTKPQTPSLESRIFWTSAQDSAGGGYRDPDLHFRELRRRQDLLGRGREVERCPRPGSSVGFTDPETSCASAMSPQTAPLMFLPSHMK